MKRILNVVSLTGRLLRANRLQFTWERLAAWINMTEVWPYRTSWIVLYIEETEEIDPKILLKTVYQQVLPFIPISTQQEPLLEIDNADSRQLEVFLSAREPQLTVRDVIRFLPCTVNLDPKLREWIVDWQATKKTLGDTTTSPYVAPDQSQQTGLLTIQRNQPQSAIGSMNQTTFDTTLSTSLGQSPMTNQPLFSTLPRPSTQNGQMGRTLAQASADQFHQWISTVGGMTDSGQKKVAKFVARENISGFVLDQLKGNYECITSGAGLNLGDGMILANAIHHSLYQPVIPVENENFTIPVPQSPSLNSPGSASIEMDGGFRLDPMGGVDLSHHQAVYPRPSLCLPRSPHSPRQTPRQSSLWTVNETSGQH